MWVILVYSMSESENPFDDQPASTGSVAAASTASHSRLERKPSYTLLRGHFGPRICRPVLQLFMEEFLVMEHFCVLFLLRD